MVALKCKYFSDSDKLVTFVNENNKRVVSICATSLSFVLFYKDQE